MSARKTTLPNGLRILTERIDHVDSASLGIWLTTGLEDEPPGLAGITHFLEHMLFKGTQSRSARQIAEAGDDIGGQINGFTHREFMYLYARTVADQVAVALALLFDLFLQSVCSEEEVAREREVVLQEIDHIEDSPEDWVQELVLQAAWPGHPLGGPPTGTRETAQSFTREAVLAYLRTLQVGRRVIVTAAGRVEHDAIVEQVARLAGDLPEGTAASAHDPPRFSSHNEIIKRPTGQVHLCLATPACTQTAPCRHAFGVLDVILGGGASSRLFQEVRESRGLAYSIGSFVQSYRTAGLLNIEAGCAPRNFGAVLSLIEGEVERLGSEGPLPVELERAKTQLRVALALAAESTSFRMQHLAGSEMYWGRVLSFEELREGIDAVTAEDVQALAREAFTPERRALVAIGPLDA